MSDDISIVELKSTQRMLDPRTRQTLTREVVTGYLLQRGQEYAGVHLSWDRRRDYMCPFATREAAEQGIQALATIGEMEYAMPQSGPVVRRLFVTVPFDAAHTPADHESLQVVIDADCAATLSAVASAMGCTPSQAVGEILKRIKEASR